MSGLLVKSTLIMRENLEVMHDLGYPTSPVLLGGAALTRTYVERDLREVYDGRVFYGKDAFEGLRVMDRLVELRRGGEDDDAVRARDLRARVPRRFARRRGARARRAARGASPEVDDDNPLFAPPFVGTPGRQGHRRSTRSREYLNLTALFRNQWGYRPEEGEDDPAFKERVRAVLREELDKAKAEDLLVPQVVWGHFPAAADGNDLVVFADDDARDRGRALHLPAPARASRGCASPTSSGRSSRRTATTRSFMLVTMGPRVSERCQRALRARTATPTTSCCTASASRWPRRWPSCGTGASARSWASPTRTARRSPGSSASSTAAGATRGATRPARTSPTTRRSPSCSAPGASA